MELLDTCIMCDGFIKRRRDYLIEHLANVLDDEREYALTLGRMATLTEYRKRILAIRKEYADLIKEVEQIAKQANQI